MEWVCGVDQEGSGLVCSVDQQGSGVGVRCRPPGQWIGVWCRPAGQWNGCVHFHKAKDLSLIPRTHIGENDSLGLSSDLLVHTKIHVQISVRSICK